MAWHRATALARIQKATAEVPDFDIQRFNDYWPMYESRQKELASRDLSASPPLFSLPKDKAVVVDTVQIYIAIANYDDFRLDEGAETEASHKRAFGLLHLYYCAADRVAEKSAAQRVDFHNGRMHAVVLERGNRGVTTETLGEALAFVDDFKKVAATANRELANGEFDALFRIGVDVGTCVAINNGTGSEQEPLFLGSSANHAAKLASGSEPGIFVSDRVRILLGQQMELGSFSDRKSLSEAEFDRHLAWRDVNDQLKVGKQDRQPFADVLVEDWRNDIRDGSLFDYTNPTFHFSHKKPPLSEIDYSELMPSRSIRMSLVSIFADLSGYTNYIDHAVASDSIDSAVRALYVIRQELQNVVEQDFDGRKVRFIGDCIHALIAEGSQTETDGRHSVSSAAQCAGGLHSSFKLCKEVLSNLEDLGLAIGLEFGPTPISRIGVRGERSVRIASSIATTRSEQMQRECKHNGVKFGPRALLVAPTALEDLLDENGFTGAMDYDEVAVCLSTAPATVSAPAYVRVHAPAEQAQPRAHFRSK